jgi:hypothetical protein
MREWLWKQAAVRLGRVSEWAWSNYWAWFEGER